MCCRLKVRSIDWRVVRPQTLRRGFSTTLNVRDWAEDGPSPCSWREWRSRPQEMGYQPGLGRLQVECGRPHPDAALLGCMHFH